MILCRRSFVLRLSLADHSVHGREGLGQFTNLRAWLLVLPVVGYLCLVMSRSPDLVMPVPSAGESWCSLVMATAWVFGARLVKWSGFSRRRWSRLYLVWYGRFMERRFSKPGFRGPSGSSCFFFRRHVLEPWLQTLPHGLFSAGLDLSGYLQVSRPLHHGWPGRLGSRTWIVEGLRYLLPDLPRLCLCRVDRQGRLDAFFSGLLLPVH